MTTHDRITYLEEALIPWYELRVVGSSSENRDTRIKEVTLLKREYHLLTEKKYQAGKNED